MSRYITHKKPSLTQRLLTTIGFGVSPQKVNCWYCCQDSYLLPGSKNTVNHWYCNLCESTNIRDKNGEIADPTVFEASSTRHIPSIERTASAIHKNSSKTLCSDCVANQEIIYRYLAEYIPDESDPTYQIKFNDVDEYKAKLHQRYKLCDACQQKIRKLNEEQRENMRRMQFTASLMESAKPQTLIRPSRHAHRVRGFAWTCVHVWTILFGTFCIVYHPQNTHFNLSSKMLQFYNPGILQEWINYFSNTCTTLLDPVRCVFSRTDEFCYWDMSYQHVMILVLMTSISFVVRDWHQLLLVEAADKLKNYGVYKHVQNGLISLRLVLFTLIAVKTSRTIQVAALLGYIGLLVVSYNAVRCAIWPYTIIGKNRRDEVQVESEEDNTAEPMDIVPDHPQQQYQQPDAVDSLVNGLHSIRFLDQ